LRGKKIVNPGSYIIISGEETKTGKPSSQERYFKF